MLWLGAFVAPAWPGSYRRASLPAPLLPYNADRIVSIHQFRPCHIARLIEQHVHASEEPHRMRQLGVPLECCFVHPPGMNEEEPPVSHGTKQMKAQASPLFARRARHIVQCLLNRTFFSLPRMQPHKHVLLHSFLLPPLIPSRTGKFIVIIGF